MQKRPIKQEHEFGCGIACVAFLVNKTYREVMHLIDPTFSKVSSVGYYCKELVQTLNELGYCYIYKYVKKHIKNKIYVDGTIVFIRRSPRYPAGHYIIRYDGRWMDPWINFVTDKHIENARSGFRKRLPGKPIYALLQQK